MWALSFINSSKHIASIIFLLATSLALNGQTSHCRFTDENYSYARLAQTRFEDKGQTVSIPVIIHVVYASAVQNISDEQIYSQIRVLNEDFNKYNSDTLKTIPAFKSIARSAKINFYIADTDDAGNKIQGVTRTSTNHTPFFNSDIHYSNRGGEDTSNADRFLNIWICDLADGVFGYASPPGTVEPTDGVVIDYSYFGTIGTVTEPYNLGRTATHEVGHYLGLKHLWGSVGACMDDDGLVDTPPQYGPSSGCDLKRSSCGGLNMVQNFMDTSYDGCMNLFTGDQVAEMRKNLFTIRPDVIREGIITGIKEQNSNEIKWIRTTGYAEYKIICPGGIRSIDIYNLEGRQCYNKSFFFISSEATLQLPNMHGPYIILIQSESKTEVLRRYID